MVFKLSDALIGQRVVVVEPIENEVRWKHYERIEGHATFRHDYLPVRSLRAVQGRPGRKPRWDSGELSNLSEMPAAALVVDAKEINHAWTEAHTGLMIVHSSGWIGIYVNSRLLHKISPSEWPYHSFEPELAIELIREIRLQGLADIPIGRTTAIWKRGAVLPDDLMQLNLRLDDAYAE
jgi:hypothetical protein